MREINMMKKFDMAYLKQIIESKRESIQWEFKGSFDIDDKSSYLKVIKHIAAFSNTEGGHIIIGVADNYKKIGVSYKEKKIDVAQINDKLKKYVIPVPKIEYKIVEIDAIPYGVIFIEPNQEKPFLMKIDGGYELNKQKKHVFRKGDIIIRRSGQSEKAGYTEIRNIIDKELVRIKDQLFKGIKRVISVPTDTLKDINWDKIRITTDESAIPFRPTDDESAPAIRQVITTDPTKSLIEKANLIAKYKKSCSEADIYEFYSTRESCSKGFDEELFGVMLEESIRKNFTGLFFIKSLSKESYQRILKEFIEKDKYPPIMNTILTILYVIGGSFGKEQLRKTTESHINYIQKKSKMFLKSIDESKFVRIEKLLNTTKKVRYNIMDENNVKNREYFVLKELNISEMDQLINLISKELTNDPTDLINKNAMKNMDIYRYYKEIAVF